MQPRTLVLDEPAAGLDPAGREEILNLIEAIHRGGVTIVMVSHSMDDVARLCTRLIVLNHGKIAFDAPPREVFRHARALEEMGLGVPECVRLSALLREKGFPLPEGLYRPDEVSDAILRALRGEGGC